MRRGRPTFVRVRVSRAALYIDVRRVAQTYRTNLGFATPDDLAAVNLSADVRYVRRIPNYMFIMDVLSYMLLLLFMLFDASSELLFNMLVAAVVMSNILELIMNLLPNFPTLYSSAAA